MKFWSRVVLAAAGVAFALSATTALAVTTPTPAAPSAPKSLRATAGDTQVTLTWSPPATGVAIDGYQISTSPADFPRTLTPATTLAVYPLTNGRLYTFSVRAHNSTGYGPASYATATPHVSPPGSPTSLAATPSGTGQITLSWTPPTSSGSFPPGGSAPTIDHYTITVSPGGVIFRTPDASTTTYVASSLADNITYTFSVTATNSRNVTGPAAIVYAPLPNGATIGLQPTAGTASTSITATGQLFLKNESITLYWDVPSHVAVSVVTDDNGAFTKIVKPFSGDKPKVHKLCASVQPKPCANFTLQPPPSPSPLPSPSPTESPTPSPVQTPPTSGTRPPGGGGRNGWDIVTKPPFVFLPIIGILGLLGVLAYWFFTGRRGSPAPTSATVVHRATRPDYMAPFPTTTRPPVTPPVMPPAGAPAPPPQPGVQPPPFFPATPPPPTVQPPSFVPPPPPPAPAPPPPAASPEPVRWPEPTPPAGPSTPPSPPAPPTWPAAPDEPPDLPQPSD